MRYNRKYLQKVIENKLPRLQEEERIYLIVPYKANGFARSTNCCFDSEKKLWFTGVYNSYLVALLNVYKISEVTSEKAKRLLEEKLSSVETNE